MNTLTAQRLAEYATVTAGAGAFAVIIAYVSAEPPPLSRPILAPIASLATTYCPDRLEVFELKLAQEACYAMALAACSHAGLGHRDYWACANAIAENCTLGNTNGGWLP